MTPSIDAEQPRTISDILLELQDSLQSERVSLDHVLVTFHERGFGFFLFLFALPMALPFPVPLGINTLLATPAILLTLQQAIGRKTIWVPRRLRNATLSRKSVEQLVTGSLPWTQRIEKFIQPRLGFMTQGIFSNLIGVLGLIMALTVCIPLPLTNTVPSFGIAIMAIGVLMRDGLAVLVGGLIGSLWVAMLAWALILFGNEGIDILKNFIKSLM